MKSDTKLPTTKKVVSMTTKKQYYHEVIAIDMRELHSRMSEIAAGKNKYNIDRFRDFFGDAHDEQAVVGLELIRKHWKMSSSDWVNIRGNEPLIYELYPYIRTCFPDDAFLFFQDLYAYPDAFTPDFFKLDAHPTKFV